MLSKPLRRGSARVFLLVLLLAAFRVTVLAYALIGRLLI